MEAVRGRLLQGLEAAGGAPAGKAGSSIRRVASDIHQMRAIRQPISLVHCGKYEEIGSVVATCRACGGSA